MAASPSTQTEGIRPGRWFPRGSAILLSAVLLISLAWLAMSFASHLRSPFGDVMSTRAVDQEMLRIADQLECPICAGQSVAFSNSLLARDMRQIILEKLEAGETEEQIVQYFVDRYGIGVLREPPRQGLGVWLWITPVIGLLAGLVGLSWMLRQMVVGQRRSGAADEQALAEESLLDEDVQELLAEYDRELLA